MKKDNSIVKLLDIYALVTDEIGNQQITLFVNTNKQFYNLQTTEELECSVVKNLDIACVMKGENVVGKLIKFAYLTRGGDVIANYQLPSINKKLLFPKHIKVANEWIALRKDLLAYENKYNKELEKNNKKYKDKMFEI